MSQTEAKSRRQFFIDAGRVACKASLAAVGFNALTEPKNAEAGRTKERVSCSVIRGKGGASLGYQVCVVDSDGTQIEEKFLPVTVAGESGSQFPTDVRVVRKDGSETTVSYMDGPTGNDAMGQYYMSRFLGRDGTMICQFRYDAASRSLTSADFTGKVNRGKEWVFEQVHVDARNVDARNLCRLESTLQLAIANR